MNHDDLVPWLRLSLVDGVGPGTARRLLAAFGPPEAIFAQGRDALLQHASPAQVDALLTLPPDFESSHSALRAWLEGSAPSGAERALIPLGDARYPAALLQIPDPPLMIYATGCVQALAALPPCLAVVGSRNPTPQGEAHARRFAMAIAARGVCIVSGLALGVDGAAHQGALDGAADGIATVAIVGTGLDRVYPSRHRALAHAIAARGVLIS
ncbi:MAG: DNA-processing protein DprA, partial [Betaproteobacteria bacterium]|nr:DNA-processing protein DprA [Betaproteobacteria bacterium]